MRRGLGGALSGGLVSLWSCPRTSSGRSSRGGVGDLRVAGGVGTTLSEQLTFIDSQIGERANKKKSSLMQGLSWDLCNLCRYHKGLRVKESDDDGGENKQVTPGRRQSDIVHDKHS